MPFPDTSDRSSVRITLERSGCLGRCPAYSVTISGDGRVDYSGGQFTAVRGERHSRVFYDDVSKLIEKFRADDFFSLAHSYGIVNDSPIFTVTFTADGKTKQVTHAGGDLGVVTDLEKEIDRVSGSARWVKGRWRL